MPDKTIRSTDSDFDFGFTAVDELELDVVQVTSRAAFSSEEKLDKLYQAVIPLLKNLKLNPEKEYILWPNRLAKVEEFEQLITEIYKG
jgi:hypothetical protein